MKKARYQINRPRRTPSFFSEIKRNTYVDLPSRHEGVVLRFGLYPNGTAYLQALDGEEVLDQARPLKRTDMIRVLSRYGVMRSPILKDLILHIYGGAWGMRSATKNGLYGFREKTAKLGLAACSDLRHAAGRLSSALHGREQEREKIADFLKNHSEEGTCKKSALLYASWPDFPDVVAEEEEIFGKSANQRELSWIDSALDGADLNY